jgi:hypothetical protein
LRQHLSILTLASVLVAVCFLTTPHFSNAQDNVSLGCCKTVEGTPSCVGCGEEGLKCAIDGALCAETDSFSLGEICVDSEIAGEAECRVAESATGCCVISQDQCEDNVAFDSCSGQHWFDGTACASIPICLTSASSSGFIDIIILAAAFVIVIFLLMKFRRKRHGT